MKIKEMLFVGEVIRPPNLTEEAMSVLLAHPDEYVMVKDKEGNPRVLKATKK